MVLAKSLYHSEIFLCPPSLHSFVRNPILPLYSFKCVIGDTSMHESVFSVSFHIDLTFGEKHRKTIMTTSNDVENTFIQAACVSWKPD